MDTIEIKITAQSYISINQDDGEITIKGDKAFEYLTEMVIDTVKFTDNVKSFDYDDFMKGLESAQEIKKCTGCDVEWVKAKKDYSLDVYCDDCRRYL